MATKLTKPNDLSFKQVFCIGVGIGIGFFVVQYYFSLIGPLGAALGGGLGAVLGLGLAKVLGFVTGK